MWAFFFNFIEIVKKKRISTDIMVEDIEEFKKLIKEKNISNVEEMQEEASKLIKEIPNIKEKYEKVIHARGYVLEPATNLEIAFNELILKTGGEDLVIDEEKKELHLTTGIKKENELGNLSFNKKAKIVRELMEKILDKPEEIPEPNMLNDFERFVAIRDIFAHVPINWFPSELEFNDNPPYKHFFKLNPKWKNVSTALNEFMNIQKGILEAIPRYIQIILLKEKMMSDILFGTNLKDVPIDDKK